MRLLNKIIFIILLVVVSANTTVFHAQYRDPSETKSREKKKKKKKSNVNKVGLFGFKGNGDRQKKNKDPFLNKKSKKQKKAKQYNSKPPDRKKNKKFVIFKNKKT